MIEYIIVGDTERYDDCLVRVLRGFTKEQAEQYLAELLVNPDKSFKQIMETHTNFRIEEVAEVNQWWNDPFLAN